MLRRVLPSYCLSLLLMGAFPAAKADEILLLIEDIPADGLIVAPIDLTAAAAWCKSGAIAPAKVRAVDTATGQPVPCQFVPGVDFDPQSHVAGTFVARLASKPRTQLKLTFDGSLSDEGEPFDGTITTASYRIRHDARRIGGFPCEITFSGSGKKVDSLRWHDRLYKKERGGFGLYDDRQPRVRRIANGPLCTVIEVAGHYVQGKQWPGEKPEAIYQWVYLHDRPLVYVTATQRQAKPFTWREAHFLELHPGEAFAHWVGGEPLQQGAFSGTQKSTSHSQWAAVRTGENDMIAMLRAGRVLTYDGKGGYGSYLHARGSQAWTEWDGSARETSGWLWIGATDKPAETLRAAARQLPTGSQVRVTVDSVLARLEAAAREFAALDPARRQQAWWRAKGARQLEAQGRFEDAVQTAGGKMPAAWTVVNAGRLGMLLERADAGVHLLGLFDSSANQQLAAADALPLFTLTMRHAETDEEVSLQADQGWQQVSLAAESAGPLDLRWQRPVDSRLGGLRVSSRAVPDQGAGAFAWTLKVDNVPKPWSVWRVVFPQLAVADLGSQGKLFYASSAGQVKADPWRQPVRSQVTYPCGWCSMPILAAYDGAGRTGLYLAVHDALGGTKDMVIKSRPVGPSLELAVDHPAPDMGRPGNGFELAGQAVWQVLPGDWFDAALIYRRWVRAHAQWYPKLTAEGRADTPLWMRELPCWALGGGAPQSCVAKVKQFAEELGVPIGFHWYSWHQIPFDNDYPHYFPTKEGFAEAVKDLQANGVYVMPYINGRLWDTRDRGTEDFQFTKIARPAATKDEKGEPYTESYSSKESDGSRVRLAAMCPTTQIWQNKVREIVLRLFNECGVKGVYIDQVAAAKPRLCFDAGHGHPLGGGHWWTEAGYWPLMDRIHQAMPADRMLTTECNAEPYVRWFDGYLSWHWQSDGQVPAFPAVYGGAIQMFGRAYRGGPTKDLALRMKAAQQLVFGEQIGWINPGVVDEKNNFPFLRDVVRLRWAFRRYFYAGQMARPPKLAGVIPRLTADWQWSGTWPVTTDALMAGAWELPAERRLLLLFANVAEEQLNATLDLDLRRYGFTAKSVSLTKHTPAGEQGASNSPLKLHQALTFPAHSVWAWEVHER